ncbi:thymidylate synthase, partial [Citrobacter amalonaticus]|nr:thymidylate synthase [Citrobacter amalonaticus]
MRSDLSILLNREHTNGQLANSSYAKVIETVLKSGVHADDRTGTGTESVSYVPSFYMLTGGSVPLISGKSVNLKPLLVELEWYLKGTGNIQFLKENGVKIWDAWADENGDLGPVYGKQWRRWNDTRIISHDEYLRKLELYCERGYKVEGYLGINENRVVLSREIDQLQSIVDKLRTNPTDRRILLNAWNVGELEDMRLPPCHFVFSLWSRELDFETRLTMATDIGLQHNRHGHESIYTQMLCLLGEQGGISEQTLDELGIPKRILN